MKRNKNFLSGFSVKLAALLLSAARTVVDHAGDTITLPDKINRIAIASIWPLPSVYCLFEGSA
jgi:iron complex transport system substrate-binding protein